MTKNIIYKLFYDRGTQFTVGALLLFCALVVVSWSVTGWDVAYASSVIFGGPHSSPGASSAASPLLSSLTNESELVLDQCEIAINGITSTWSSTPPEGYNRLAPPVFREV